MKRDKVNFLSGALSLAAVVMALAFGSCTKEPKGSYMLGGDGMQVRVTFPRGVVSRTTTGGTEVGTADENRLDRVAILVFNEDGSVLETVLSEDVRSSNTSLSTSQPKWASEQTLLVSPVINLSSPKKIYAMANWSRTAFDKATYTEEMLKQELTTIAAVADLNCDAAYPMLMSGSKAVENITSLFYNVAVDMERQVSKIGTLLTIPMDVQNNLPQIEWQTELMKITVVNVPDKSYVVGRAASPAGVTLLNSDPLAVDDTKPLIEDQTVPASKDLKWGESVYIAENPVAGALQANKDASTYIVVQLPYKNRISGTIDYDNYYKLHVNDTRDAASPHKVLRNTIYNFNIRILGMGLPVNNLIPDVNIDDQLTINSWESGEIGEVEFPNDFFNIDRTYIGFQLFETSFQSTLATNVVDWKLVKQDGSTILSFAEGKTADAVIDEITYTLSGSATTATITVSRAVSEVNFSSQKMFFVAKNLKVPFTIASDNGWIPNSVLQSAGWPSSQLPKTGLQLAKIGNVPPESTAATYDPNIQWSTENVYLDSFSESLGTGKGNYAILNKLDAVTYPIGHICKALGSEWYVPSIKEMKLIYDNRYKLIGGSYSFPNSGYYFSSTNFLNHYAWGQNFSYYNEVPYKYAEKSSSRGVRCVRGI